MVHPDDIKGYSDHHAALSASIDAMLTSIMRPFQILNDSQFSAPWRRPEAKKR